TPTSGPDPGNQFAGSRTPSDEHASEAFRDASVLRPQHARITERAGEGSGAGGEEGDGGRQAGRVDGARDEDELVDAGGLGIVERLQQAFRVPRGGNGGERPVEALAEDLEVVVCEARQGRPRIVATERVEAAADDLRPVGPAGLGPRPARSLDRS